MTACFVRMAFCGGLSACDYLGMVARPAGQYLQAWHDRHAGATSAVLGDMFDLDGRSSYRVLVDAMLHVGQPVLDLACGDGHLIELLAPETSVVGADWSPSELGGARRRLGRSFPLVRADAARLPLPPGALGGVSCHFALMLLQPLEAVLSEVARVLRPDGLLAAVLPAAPPEGEVTLWSALREAWRMATAHYPVAIPPLQDNRALRRQDLACLLGEAGFASVTIQAFSVSKVVSVEEAKRALLLTYLPELLPPEGFAALEEALERLLVEQAAADGTALFVEHATLATAHRG